MATYYGNQVVFSLGGHEVDNLREVTIEETINTVDDSKIGQFYDTHNSITAGWSGSFRVMWDPELDAMAAVLTSRTAQTNLALLLYVKEQATRGTPVSGDPRISGSVIITGISGPGAERSNVVEATVSFIGDGALTHDLVP